MAPSPSLDGMLNQEEKEHISKKEKKMPNDKPDLEHTLANCAVLTKANLSPFKIVFVNIDRLYRENLTSNELYDIVRWCWRVSKKRVSHCEYVFAVHRTKVVGIFANPRWKHVTPEAKLQGEGAIIPYSHRMFFKCDDPARFITSNLIGKTLAADVYIQNVPIPIQYNYQ